MSTKKNTLLIGMPGSGKSTVGRVLAEKTGLDFIDIDVLIEEREGLRLQEIIEQKGLDYFLQVEENVLLDLDLENYVISPGGSAVQSHKAMMHLRDICDVIYLKCSIKRLLINISNIDTRGIAFKPGQSFDDLYEERCPLYEKYADFTVDVSKGSEKMAAEKILDYLDTL